MIPDSVIRMARDRKAQLDEYCRIQLEHTGPGESPWSRETQVEIDGLEAFLKPYDKPEKLSEKEKLMAENGQLRAALNEMFELVQGTRIREVQAMNEAGWDQHHRDAAQEDWDEINEIHKRFNSV